jgi:hypothetical protein
MPQRFRQTYKVDKERRARATEALRLAHEAGGRDATDDLPLENEAEMFVEAVFFGPGKDPAPSETDEA